MIIEHAGVGIPLCSEFRAERGRELVQYRPRVDKETRLAAQTAKIEGGLVLLPAAAPWLAAFRGELLAFPNGRHDDQVDSLAQFLDWTGRRRAGAVIERQLNGGQRVRPVGRARRPAWAPRPGAEPGASPRG